jgi:iron(III) transport system substrate-binding protein
MIDRMRTISRFLFWAFLLMSLVFVGCLGSSEPASTPVAPAPTATTVPQQLTVYSGRSEILMKPIIDKFIANVGVEVAVKYGKTSEMVSTLLEERSKTPADVFFAQDPGGLGAVESMFVPLSKETLRLVPAWAKSDKGVWVGISGRSRTVVYNTDKINVADLPKTLNGFTDPKWNGRIGWAPRNGSFQTMISAMRHLWGDEKTKGWLKSIAANGAKEFSNNSTQVVATDAGEIHIGLVNHYYLHRILAEKGTLKAKNYHLSEGGPGSFVMVAGAGILKTSSNSEAAQKFINYMLSDEAQKYFAEKTYEYPMVSSVKISPEMAPLEMVPSVPLSTLGDLKGTQAILRELGLIA